MCVRQQVSQRHENEAELKCIKENLAAKEKAVDEMTWPSDFFGQEENFQCWMSFCDAYSDADHYRARFMQFINQDTEPAAAEEATQLMAAWAPVSGLHGRELYDSLRARARASFAETESEANMMAAGDVEYEFSDEYKR